MALLFSNEILHAVDDELKSAQESVQIITAYCKEKTFAHLDSCIDDDVQKKSLLVRFRLDDVIKGSTDFSILNYAKQNGWNVYIRFDLHAKTYIIDNKRGLVGSANATNSGLSIGKVGNMEMATLVDVEPQDIEKISRLFEGAILVTDELFVNMEKQIDNLSSKDNGNGFVWNDTITSLFNPHIDTLFSHELPDKIVLENGEYISFLDEVFDGDKEKLKEIFRWSNVYLWLLEVLKENDGCMFFGAITKALHNTLISDPKPFRRDVKQMLSNVLDLIVELDMDEIIIDRPNYSQRVRLKAYNYGGR